jgi:hypothetical protein
MRRWLVRFFASGPRFFRALALFCVSALVLFSTVDSARAEQRSKVVLLDPGVPSLSGRLLEELEALGLDAVLLVPSEAGESLEESARRNEALAAIRISGSGSGVVEMTIVDRATGKTVSRRLAITTPSDPASSELIATRTVELLRASLMELSAAHPPRGEVKVAEPELEVLTAEEEPGWRLGLAVGAGAVKGSSFGFSVGAWTLVNLVSRDGVGVTGQVFLPVVAAELSTSEGRIELRPSLYRLGGLWVLGDRRTFSGYLQGGVMLGVLALSGSAETPYFGVREDELVGGPWLGAGSRWGLTSRLGLLLGVDAALCYPKTVVRSAGDEVTTFGRPAMSGVLGLEMTWP